MVAAAQTEAPAGVIAALELPHPEALSTHSGDRLGLILDRVGDPGNLGTMLRTADALGVRYAATLPGTVDLFSPKVVRAGMGAHFRLDLYQHADWDEVRRQLENVCVLAAASKAGELLPDVEWPERIALVIGSEAHGLSKEIEATVNRRVRVPMRAGVESLNAAVAASIIMYAAIVTSRRPVD
jgi:TrmH family RNA methyltransferase